MREITSFKTSVEDYKNSLVCAIDCFRKGSDENCLNNFLSSINELEDLLEYEQNISHIIIDKILPEIQLLYEYVKNKDTIGMADLLEFKIYPIIEEWIKGCK